MGDKRGLTGNQLKLIAIIAMLIDHIASTIIWQLYLDASVVNGINMMGDRLPPRAKQLHLIYTIMRVIGRITFPIFAFMLVEGFLHTRSLKRYMKRLFMFALISEIPYDLANSHRIVSFSGQNVIWTFLIGLVVLDLISKSEDLGKGKGLIMAIILVGEISTFLIQSDYYLGGIVFISIIYIFRNNPKYMMVGGTIVLAIMSQIFMPIQIFGLGAFILIRHYNRSIGRGSKYLFYIFYPAHLLILGIISMAIFT